MLSSDELVLLIDKLTLYGLYVLYYVTIMIDADDEEHYFSKQIVSQAKKQINCINMRYFNYQYLNQQTLFQII
jgi:hypothetical protein